MKRQILSVLLTLTIALTLLPAAASAADTTLPDWYFLFAIFKNVDAGGTDKDGKAVHVKYTMSQDEMDVARNHAREFETYMNQVGVMRAHVDVVEIDAAVTELHNEYSGGSAIDVKQAAPLLEGKVDLDRYDHVMSIISLDNLKTSYLGLTGDAFENGTGHSCLNFVNREQCLKTRTPETNSWILGNPVHEFLHFMEYMSKKWGAEFSIHVMRDSSYYSSDDNSRNCYTDIMRNQFKGDAQLGTGVHPVTWQYPPHVLRTMTGLTIPSDVTSIGSSAFARCKSLAETTIPSSVTSLGSWAFRGCTALTRATILANVTSIGESTFQACSSLTGVSLPASITSVGDYAFVNCFKLTDVYYGGTEEQWKAIRIGEYNGSLTKANIHYNRLLADVKTTDYFAQAVAWAMDRGIASGTGNSQFSPRSTCTRAQILTFLWRAKGSPDAAGAVTGSEYYAVPVQWAKEQGIVSADISPNAPCTRSDAVTCLWKLAGSPAASGGRFADVSADADCARAVAWAVTEGITSGTGADTFSPDSACTRGQIVTFLYRALA